jgi:phosphorylated CTD-interacting factor 1
LESAIQARASPFCRRELIMPSHQHDYVDGLQHLVSNNKKSSAASSSQSGPGIFKAVHDTQVLFLQNASGFAKWTPTDDRVQQLQKIWMGQ